MGEKVVLLVAPVGMRESPEYLMAFGLAEERHPDQRVVADAELWSTAKEFGKTYKHKLSSFVISDFYVLTAPDGTVGQGILQMWHYLVQHQKSKTTALVPTSGEDGFEEFEECELKVISNDSARYAIPVRSTASAPK